MLLTLACINTHLTCPATRIGMHLLFCGREQVKLLESGKIEKILREQSVKVTSFTSSSININRIFSFSKALSTTHLRVQNQSHPSFNRTRSTHLNSWSKTFHHTKPLTSFSSGEHVLSWKESDLILAMQKTQARCSPCPEYRSASVLLGSRLPFNSISECRRSWEVLVSYSYSNGGFIFLSFITYNWKPQDQRRWVYDLTTSHRLEVRDRLHW